MLKRMFGSTGFLAVVLTLSITGCGKETVNVPDTTPPRVLATTPVQGAANVSLNTAVSATFSKAMNATTISTTTFTVTGPGGTAVAGTVAYVAAGAVATFTPNVSLAPSTQFTATITTGAQDQASPANALAAKFVWTFTTGTAPDTTRPTVTSMTPANATTGVPVNQIVSATFSEAMNPTTISAASFTVAASSGTAVAGVVTYSTNNFVATFTPTTKLAYSTQYTGTITGGTTDVAGNALGSSVVWSFTTAAAPDITPPTVIATVPTNGATGVPTNQVLTATFSEAVNCATLKSPATSFILTGPGTTVVPGTVNCTGAVATFTSAALLAPNTLFTATITTGVTDLAGNALTSNFVWSFRTGPAPTLPTVISTAPSNGATAVPINQALTASFSEGMNPATITPLTFTLKGPGGVAVAGAVTYVVAGSIATFTPAVNLEPSTAYTATITTGATDLGNNAMANNFIWSFTTAAAPDTTKPTVVATNPANAAANVPFNQVVSATFSKPMNPATISGATFVLNGPGGTAMAGLVSYAGVGNLATFTPTANLAPNTLFTATITTGAADLAGNKLAINYVWTFTTGTVPDTTKPQVLSTSPVNGAAGVSLSAAVSATFSEAMDPLTITTATFQLTGPGGTQIVATVAYDSINFIATLTPLSPLSGNSIYTAIVTNGATDLAGNPLGNGGALNPWSFTTGTVIIPPPVNLGTAALFGGFGGDAGMTNQGTSTVINGNIGTTGVSTLITGFHDSGPGCIYTETPLNVGTVNGAIDTAPPPPTVACPNEGTAVTAAIAAKTAADALTAYGALVAFPNGLDVSTCPGCGGGSAGELGGRTLNAGIYKSAPGTYDITLGDLTLDARGDPNAFWVFQMASTLTVGSPSSNRNVILVNGAQAKNIFWQVGTAATINGILGGGTMQGTIIAQAGVSISTAGVAAVTTINGRALVLSGPVTMVNTVINVPAQ
jgi:hypothetical protein